MGRPFVIYGEHAAAAAKDGAIDCAAREEMLQRWKNDLEEAGNMNVMALPHLDQYLRYLYSLRRTAYSMEVVTPETELSRTASKVGGLPFLLPNEPWPRNRDESGCPDPEGAEMTFIMQIQVSEMPDEVRALLGVDDGLMQLFFDDDLPAYDINTDQYWFLARVLTPEQLAESTELNQARPQSARILVEKAVVGWTSHDDYPSFLAEEPCPEDISAIMDPTVMSDVQEILANKESAECTAGDKFGGWPHWCQSPEWATVDGTQERYIHVLQLEAEHCPEISIGDSGTLVLQRHPRCPSDFRVGWACC